MVAYSASGLVLSTIGTIFSTTLVSSSKRISSLMGMLYSATGIVFSMSIERVSRERFTWRTIKGRTIVESEVVQSPPWCRVLLGVQIVLCLARLMTATTFVA